MGKHKHRFITFTTLSTITTGSIYAINQMISASALLSCTLAKPKKENLFQWRFGEIYYTKKGSGKPLLLIHDLTPGASGCEFAKIEESLSRSHTVYTLDLLGCGRSEKPKITYTNFIFVQLLNDFTKKVIKEKTDVIVSGFSSSFVVMACNNNPDIFNRILFINPADLSELMKIPYENTKAQKFLLELPVFGTMLYHILFSMFHVEHLFMEKYFFNPFHLDKNYMKQYYETAHIGKGAGKYLYASIIGRYLNFNITKALKKINNSIFIIGGKQEPDIDRRIENYLTFNPSIEYVLIDKSKELPHLEQPEEFLQQIPIFLSEEN